MAPVTLFYSYAAADEELQQELRKHFGALRREGLIEEWDTRMIPPGAEREQIIKERLKQADFVLLFASADFFADPDIPEEELEQVVARQRKGGSQVIVIRLRPMDMQGTVLENLPYLPKGGIPVTGWSDKDKAFRSIAQSIRELVEDSESEAIGAFEHGEGGLRDSRAQVVGIVGSGKIMLGIILGLLALINPLIFFLLAIYNIVNLSLWLIVLIGLFCEIFLLISAFLVGLWQRLSGIWLDRAAKELNYWSRNLLSKYYRRYCLHLIREHHVFDVKGLSLRTAHALELEQVFVDLHIDSTAPQQASKDLLQLPVGKHAIWKYLASPELKNSHLVIIGTPGSGKTTLLKSMTLRLAQPKKYREYRQLVHRLPILLFLREHVNSIKTGEDFTVVEAIQNHLQKKGQRLISASWFLRYLRKGRCLILLDGLDEVSDMAMREQVVEWVQRQMLLFGQNRFILTSRPHGYQNNQLEDVTVLEVHSFSRSQIEKFVHNWYLSNELKEQGRDEPDVHVRAKVYAQDLLRRVHDSLALRALAVNPLLLTMIATVHSLHGSLPDKRVALYEEICRVLLGERQRARGIPQEITAVHKQEVLQLLAYGMMCQGLREIEVRQAEEIIASQDLLISRRIAAKAFLESIQQGSGLLLERNPGLYGFAHLTFQEYLAASYIKQMKKEGELIEQVESAWWKETIRLYCAQTDATAFIGACLDRQRPSIQVLQLILECQQEAKTLQPALGARIDSLLTQGIEDPDPELRWVVAEALLARRLQRMVRLHESVYIDTSLVSCAEYQVFLNEQKNIDKPEHWRTRTYVVESGNAPILGVSWAGAQAFCDWLTARDVGLWRYRLPMGNEWQEKAREEEIRVTLPEGTGYWLREKQVEIESLPIVQEKMNILLKASCDRDKGNALVRATNSVRSRSSSISESDCYRALERIRGLDYDMKFNRVLELVEELETISASDRASVDPGGGKKEWTASVSDYGLAHISSGRPQTNATVPRRATRRVVTRQAPPPLQSRRSVDPTPIPERATAGLPAPVTQRAPVRRTGVRTLPDPLAGNSPFIVRRADVALKPPSQVRMTGRRYSNSNRPGTVRQYPVRRAVYERNTNPIPVRILNFFRARLDRLRPSDATILWSSAYRSSGTVRRAPYDYRNPDIVQARRFYSDPVQHQRPYIIPDILRAYTDRSRATREIPVRRYTSRPYNERVLVHPLLTHSERLFYRILDRTLKRAQILTIKKEEQRVHTRSFYFSSMRLSAYTLALYFRYCSQLEEPEERKAWYLPSRNKNRANPASHFGELLDAYLELYITCVLLEERIEARLPAWEGILLIKERVEDPVGE